jgi:hypothetical protein
MKRIKTYRQNHLLILNVYKFSHRIFTNLRGLRTPLPGQVRPCMEIWSCVSCVSSYEQTDPLSFRLRHLSDVQFRVLSETRCGKYDCNQTTLRR